MNDKYDEAWREIVFKIATLIFPETTITNFHINLAECWARQVHIFDVIYGLDDKRINPTATKVEK